MRIGVLALQGAFTEHIRCLNELGADCFEIRQRKDLDQPFDGLILPGGESTVQGKLLRELGLFEPLTQQIKSGLPVLATCAGMILLASKLEDDSTVHFGTLPVTVRRNAYGRQSGSSHILGDFQGLGTIPMTFIRAPYITKLHSSNVTVLALKNNHITAVRYQNQLALSFHPELDQDLTLHRYFLEHFIQNPESIQIVS